jgi:hypothetical protein
VLFKARLRFLPPTVVYPAPCHTVPARYPLNRDARRPGSLRKYAGRGS